MADKAAYHKVEQYTHAHLFRRHRLTPTEEQQEWTRGYSVCKQLAATAAFPGNTTMPLVLPVYIVSKGDLEHLFNVL